ncbi:MAG: GGDEF domain-containing protein [Eubacteriales bacterium]|nr:GGDEF domain-containing protein [Eubacteriales bacterium]
MKKLFVIQADVPLCERENFRKRKLLDNLRRGEILAAVIIAFELVFIIADVSAFLLNADDRFRFNDYLVMYSILIGISVLFISRIRIFRKTTDFSERQMKIMETWNIGYITLIMSWGSVVSLMDQRLYGQLMVFMVMMIVSSVMFLFSKRQMIIPYAVAVPIMCIGLPFFQSSSDVLIGDYVNLLVFIVTSWVASRIIFGSYINDYNANSQLQTSKQLLEEKIKENQSMNHKLVLANLQLKQMALLDDLTGIPNRRGFRNFIDIEFDRNQEDKLFLAVLFIDIDYFKQYNDNYGHDIGDKVLVEVTGIINTIDMNADEVFFCRWGGDEFVISVFNSSRENALNIAETIRRNVCQLKVIDDAAATSAGLSVSIGVGTALSAGKEDVGRVFRLADEALLLAKSNGRNRIECIVGD